MRFGVYEVDLETGELRKSGVKIKLQDQPFQVLTALLENPGQLVTKEDLQQRLWPDDTFVDFDQSLTTAINKLRRALNDSATQPRYIETLPRRGYRFIAPVENNGRPPAGQPHSSPEIQQSRLGEAERLRRQRLILLAALAAALVALVMVGLSPRQPETQPMRRFSFEPESFAERPGRRISVSPDGRHIVYLGGEESSLWVRDLVDETPRLLAGTAGASRPFWSPDSTWIGYGVGSQLRRISVHGGPSVVICELSGGIFSGGAWAPDGNSVVFSSGLPPVLYSAPVEGGSPTPFIEPEVTESGGANVYPRFVSIGGKARGLIFSVGGPGDQEMVVVDLHTMDRRRLGPGAFPAYDSRGYLVYQAGFADAGLWAMPFDGDTLQPVGSAFPLEPSGVEVDVADDGTLVYLDAPSNPGRQQLIWVDRSGKPLGTIGAAQDRMRQPELSPDGRTVAVSGFDEGNNDVWLHDTVRGTKTRLTFDPAVETSPIWHPSGRSVAYRFDRTGNAEIFERAVDRSEPPHALLATPATEIPNSWSPDGRSLVYSRSDSTTRYDIFMRGESPEEQIPLVVTPFNDVGAEVSPDGRFLAYSSDETGDYEVYVQPFPSGSRRWQVSSGGGAQPRWSANGRELFFVQDRTLLAAEVFLGDEFSSGTPTPLFEHPGLSGRGALTKSYDVSGDGARFVLPETIEREQPDRAPRIRVIENWSPVPQAGATR